MKKKNIEKNDAVLTEVDAIETLKDDENVSNGEETLNEEPTKKEKKAKKVHEYKVMERYANAPSISHLLVLVFSLLFLAIIIIPNVPYLFNGGFDVNARISFADFGIAFMQQLDGRISIDLGNLAPSAGYLKFDSLVIPDLMNMMHLEQNIFPFVFTVCGLLGGLIFLVTAIYSFVCVIGGIGRKHAMPLGYTILAGSLIAFAPAVALFVISLIEKNTMELIYPIVPGVAILLTVVLIIIVHIVYNKHIKYTYNLKQAVAHGLIENSEETKDQVEEVQETLLDDSVNKSVVADIHAQNQERDKIAEAAEADDNLVLQGQEKELETVPVVEQIDNIEENKDTFTQLAEPVASETKKEEVEVEEVKYVEPFKVEEPVKVEEAKKEETKPAVKNVPAPRKKPTPPAKPIKKVEKNINLDPSKGLPEDLKELGDHAFSKNLDLEFANIPDGIEKIGPACFANCLNLKVVIIPTSVSKISFNAFFACKKLTKIEYKGTKTEWKKIVRGSNWLSSAGTKIVVCKDGAISVNVFH